jgi:hypothetical protein
MEQAFGMQTRTMACESIGIDSFDTSHCISNAAAVRISNTGLGIKRQGHISGRRGEAYPCAGIIQIKFNGIFSERVMPKQSSNTRYAVYL